MISDITLINVNSSCLNCENINCFSQFVQIFIFFFFITEFIINIKTHIFLMKKLVL